MEDSEGDARLRDVFEIVACSHAAVMVLQVPSTLIVAASPGAQELLDGIARPLVGHRLQDYVEDGPSGAMRLLAGGEIRAYETVHALKSTGERRRLWIRALSESEPARHALAVLITEGGTAEPFIPRRDDEAGWPVIGSTDPRLIIDRISCAVEECLGFPAEEMIGMSFLSLISPDDVGEVLAAMAQLAENPEGLLLQVRVVGVDFVLIPLQLVLFPLEPTPRLAFAFLIEGSEGTGRPDGRSVTDLISRLSLGIRGASTSEAVVPVLLRPEVDLGQLSRREFEIVSLLMAGNRVSSIAGLLFLSDGTIRNHLSAVFGKLGVKTQQQLIELLRPVAGPGPHG